MERESKDNKQCLEDSKAWINDFRVNKRKKKWIKSKIDVDM